MSRAALTRAVQHRGRWCRLYNTAEGSAPRVVQVVQHCTVISAISISLSLWNNQCGVRRRCAVERGVVVSCRAVGAPAGVGEACPYCVRAFHPVFGHAWFAKAPNAAAASVEARPEEGAAHTAGARYLQCRGRRLRGVRRNLACGWGGHGGPAGGRCRLRVGAWRDTLCITEVGVAPGWRQRHFADCHGSNLVGVFRLGGESCVASVRVAVSWGSVAPSAATPLQVALGSSPRAPEQAGPSAMHAPGRSRCGGRLRHGPGGARRNPQCGQVTQRGLRFGPCEPKRLAPHLT